MDVERPATSTSRWKVATCVLLAVTGFFLLTEHRAHVLGVLPYLLVLLCPLMHLFMHREHGERGGHVHDPEGDRS